MKLNLHVAHVEKEEIQKNNRNREAEERIDLVKKIKGREGGSSSALPLSQKW